MEMQSLSKAMLSLLDTASEGFWFMDDDNDVQFYNSTFYRQFHSSLNDARFRDWLVLVHPEDRYHLVQEVALHQQGQISEKVKARYRVKNLSGRYLWIEATGVRVECDGRLVTVGSHKNVSEEVLLNEYLTHIASHDGETGLFNRQQFLQALPSLSEEGWILVCRLNQLRQFQRRVGEDAIGYLSSSLVSVLDGVLTLEYGLYRIAADVFVVTLDNEFDHTIVYSTMEQILSRFDGYRSYNTAFESRLGLGALSVSDIDFDRVIEQIFNISEYAQSKGAPIVYTIDMQRDIDRKFAIQDALEDAIETQQITIDVQPIIQISTGDIISFEVLARWEHPDFGPISPLEFIPIAEKWGHIYALGLEIIKQSCNYLLTFDAVHESKPNVNINVSAYQLLNKKFVDELFEIVKQFDVSPNRIILEMTESYLLDDVPTIRSTLQTLHTHGFRLSLDDFGSGMSAITSLFDLPLYQVKLDRELVNQAMRRDSCMKLIAHLCEFGKTHNIALVAEGVESENICKRLAAVGVPYLQGYFFCRASKPQKWLISGPY